MATIFIRTLIIYVILIATMRFLGKRQIGEMQISELVTTFLLSDLASLPLSNPGMPLSQAAVPIITLVCLEVAFSFLPTKLPVLKKLTDSPPSIIVGKGMPDRREMLRMRMSLEDLFCEMQLAGYTALSEIEYAILEPNGKLAFFPKAGAHKPCGIAHPVVLDGRISARALKNCGKSEAELRKLIKESRAKAEKDIFIMTVDDGGKTELVTKKEAEG